MLFDGVAKRFEACCQFVLVDLICCFAVSKDLMTVVSPPLPIDPLRNGIDQDVRVDLRVQISRTEMLVSGADQALNFDNSLAGVIPSCFNLALDKSKCLFNGQPLNLQDLLSLFLITQGVDS